MEQFMLLAKNAKGLALVDLVTRATAEPGLFTFGEILSLPAVQQVSRTHRRSHCPPRLPPNVPALGFFAVAR